MMSEQVDSRTHYSKAMHDAKEEREREQRMRRKKARSATDEIVRAANLSDLECTIKTLMSPVWDDTVDDETRWLAIVVFAGLIDVRPPKQHSTNIDRDEWLHMLVDRVVDYSTAAASSRALETPKTPKTPKTPETPTAGSIKKNMMTEEIDDWGAVILAVKNSANILLSP